MSQHFDWAARIACAAAVLFSAAGASHAAASSGITIGLNYASLEDVRVDDAETTYDNRTGTHFGLYAMSALGPLGLRVGAIYLNAGPLFEGLSDGLDDPASLNDTFDVRYFVVPIDLQYRLITPALKPYLLFGPELRFNVTSAGDFEDNFRSTVWGGNVGIGIEFKLPFLGLSLAPEARYTFDLTDVTDKELKIGSKSLSLDDAYRGGTYHLRLHVGF
ncbi:MAG: PorT family protein [Candidatus Eisenbacteria bacterium]|nr:PorT family protein [Candidatus Eisenbacteria bacterium]